MTISIHLVSVPTEEVLPSRVVYLPEDGGTIGRATSCNIVLPDQSKRISRVHGEIVLQNSRYFVKDSSNNGISLNGQKLVKDRAYPLNDGDIVKVEGYTMLISTLNGNNKQQTDNIANEVDPFNDNFSLEMNDDLDFLEESPEVNVINENENSASHFSSENVLSDDPFSADPFEDLEAEKVIPNKEEHHFDSFESATEQTQEVKFFPANADQNSHLNESIDKLLLLTEKNQQYLQNPQLQHEALFSALESTVEQFLNEFSPKNLENQFSEYIPSGLFVNKEKKYWRIYHKHFQHRLDNGDYRRQFKALFMENIQNQGEDK